MQRGEGKGGVVIVVAMHSGGSAGANQAHHSHTGKGGQPREEVYGLWGGEGGRGSDSVSNAMRALTSRSTNFLILCKHSITHQVRWSRERVRLAAAGLAVAEAGGRKAVDGHVDEAPDPRVLQDVLLTRLGLEHHIERERFQLVRLLLGELQKNMIIKRCNDRGAVPTVEPHPYSAVARKLDDAEVVVLDFAAVERPHPHHDVDVVAVDFVLRPDGPVGRPLAPEACAARPGGEREGGMK